LTRKRDTPGTDIAKLHSKSRANSSRCRSFISAFASALVTSPVSFWLVRGFIVPCSFMLGGKSLETNRSEPPDWLIAVNSLMMYDFACSSVSTAIVHLQQ
jgi:hypothetical protein